MKQETEKKDLELGKKHSGLKTLLIVAGLIAAAVILFHFTADTYSYPVVGKGIANGVFYYQGYDGCQYGYSIGDGKTAAQSKQPLSDQELDTYRITEKEKPEGIDTFTDLVVDTPEEWLFIQNESGGDSDWKLVSINKATGKKRILKSLADNDNLIIADKSWLEEGTLFVYGSQEWGISMYQIVEDETGIKDLKLLEEALPKTEIPFLVTAAPWIWIGLIMIFLQLLFSPAFWVVLVVIIILVAGRAAQSRKKEKAAEKLSAEVEAVLKSESDTVQERKDAERSNT